MPPMEADDRGGPRRLLTGAALPVTVRNLVHAAFSLGPCLFAVAYRFVPLAAPDLAMVSNRIGLRGIAVRIIFAVMLTPGVGTG